MKISDFISTWLKDNKLNNHYIVNDGMIECQEYHSGGVNRVRIMDDGIYYWKLSNSEFNKITLNIADPDFFEKLEAVLYNHCTDRRRKIYRQL